MNRLTRCFLTGALAACAICVTIPAQADCFGYFDCMRQESRSQSYSNHNAEPRYEDPYYNYQRSQRQADSVRRQQETASNEYRRDIQQFKRQHQYIRQRNNSSGY